MKVAIANRGEVAVRIIRACQELGHQTVLLHSEVDVNSRAYRMSDEQVCIGPAESQNSYLSIENNINGAKSVGADALHPGFGFLSENADFAQACEENGLLFIGPSPECIRLFGDKISAKKLVSEVGDFLIPGYQGEDQSLEKLQEEALKIGFPLVVKAADGGGGRGIKIARSESEVLPAIESAMREGQAAFGSSRVFLEKYLDQAKHIEVQIFGTATGKVFQLGERECSVQRRHQKVIEESPSPLLPPDLREKILAAAVSIVQKAKYRGAGTVEFLWQDGQFYFLEVNTRLQVEHPVTEMVFSVDLVKAQLRDIEKMDVGWFQDELTSKGYAIECRIYAEDSYNSGLPSIGKLGTVHFPQGPGRRFEYGFEKDDQITSFYDSMIAKVIVWDENRPRALEKMRQTLKETILFGVKTNIPFLLKILSHPEFVDGSMTTQFLGKHFPHGIPASEQINPLSEEEQNQLFQSFLRPEGRENRGSYNEVHPSPWFHQI